MSLAIQGHRWLDGGVRMAAAMLLIAVVAVFPAAAQPMEDLSDTAFQIRSMIVDRENNGRFTCAGEMVCGIQLLPDFYTRRDYSPAWTTERDVSPQANELLEAIRNAAREGLRPSDYHLDAIVARIEEVDLKLQLGMPVNPKIRAELDILLSDAFLLLASHLYGGRVNPETIHAEWVPFHYDVDLTRVLEDALANDRVGTALQDLHPSHVGYTGIQKALARYREIAAEGGWPQVPEGPSLRPGDEFEAVGVLRKRLMTTGDLTDIQHFNPYLYDGPLETAVRRFQRRHGAEVDGIVGQQTRRLLNVTAKERVRQLEINMERWRWVPHELGKRYLLVNIADFSLQVVEDGRPISEMRVIVGRPYRSTPVFSSKMTYLVFNPYWNVPYKLAVLDLLPKIRDDVGFIRKQGFRIFSSWAEDAPEIDPSAVDWESFTRYNFPYRLRQEPGPQNALGRIKFMFPNKFAVYLHDTPSRRLFETPVRGYSSGCIRVERPFWLAEYVLKNQQEWTAERINALINSGEHRVVRLNSPIDVHLLYWTAWVSGEGVVHFRDDIYRRDMPLARALAERLPAS